MKVRGDEGDDTEADVTNIDEKSISSSLLFLRIRFLGGIRRLHSNIHNENQDMDEYVCQSIFFREELRQLRGGL